MKKIFTTLVALNVGISIFSQTVYCFDNSAKVTGCAKVLLQKISNDWQNELIIEIQIDSIPKYKELEIPRYSKFIKVYLNKFPKKNSYVNEICDDVAYPDKKVLPAIKYEAITGGIIITKWTKEFVISVTVKDVLLKDNDNRIIKLPFEVFNELRVGWMGG